jgi:F-type H+-transporting ATPase subunit gamma
MASQREIRRRIRSVRNISQITRAMEMVAASRLRRAQQRVTAARPYTERLNAVIANLSGAAGAAADEDVSFPLLDQRPIQRVALILVTPDRGLTGPLNSNVIRRASRYILNEAGVPVSIIAVGRKGRDFMVRYGREVVAEFTALGDYPTLNQITPITQIAVDDFVAGRVDAVFVVYSRFVNTLTQVPDIQQVLPVQPPADGDASAARAANFIFEPSPAAVLNQLLPRYVDQQVYRAILESIASEHAARMVAMRNATDNARDLVSELTLSMNKARQAQITREVSEIAAGANALRG